MDEPFAGVVIVSQEVTLNLLKELKTRNLTVMVSTHDLNMAMQYFERVLVFNREVIAYGETGLVLTQDTIRNAFSPHLLMLMTWRWWMTAVRTITKMRAVMACIPYLSSAP